MVSLSLVALLVLQQNEQPDQASRHQRLVQALQEESLSVAAMPTLMMINEMQTALELDAKTARKLELLVKRDSQRFHAAAKQGVELSLVRLRLNADLPEVVYVNGHKVALVDTPGPQGATIEFGIAPHNRGLVLAYSAEGPNPGGRVDMTWAADFRPATSNAWDKVLEAVPLERVGRFEREHAARKKKAVVGALFHALSYRLQLRADQEEPVREFLEKHVRLTGSRGVFSSAEYMIPSLPEAGPKVLTERQRKIWRLLRLNGYGASEW